MNWLDINDEAKTKDLILTASKCGKRILSYWIRDELRWHFYAKDEEPLGWFAIPEHTNA